MLFGKFSRPINSQNTSTKGMMQYMCRSGVTLGPLTGEVNNTRLSSSWHLGKLGTKKEHVLRTDVLEAGNKERAWGFKGVWQGPSGDSLMTGSGGELQPLLSLPAPQLSLSKVAQERSSGKLAMGLWAAKACFVFAWVNSHGPISLHLQSVSTVSVKRHSLMAAACFGRIMSPASWRKWFRNDMRGTTKNSMCWLDL